MFNKGRLVQGCAMKVQGMPRFSRVSVRLAFHASYVESPRDGGWISAFQLRVYGRVFGLLLSKPW